MLRDKGTAMLGVSDRMTKILTGRLIAALLAVAGSAWGQTPTMPVEVSEIIRAGKLNTPNNFSLTLDANGNIFVGGGASNNVLRFAPRGDKPVGGKDLTPCATEIFNPSLASDHGFEFAAPKGIAIASDGTVYVTGTGGNPSGEPAGVNDDVVGIFPDGTIAELANRDRPIAADWNPAGIAIEERDEGTFVYATGPAGGGETVRMGPNGSADRILPLGGQGLVVDDLGNVYVALPANDQNSIYQIPDATHGICGTDGKVCSPLIADGDIGCDGNPIHLDGPYALALAGGILYASMQDGGNVVRLALRPDNVLGLPVCPEEIFANGDDGLTLTRPRALAADGAGNVYAAGNVSGNVIWLRPDPTDKTRVIPQEIINKTAGLDAPRAIAVDSQGNVYVSGANTSNVFRIRTITAGLACGNGAADSGEKCDYTLDCCCSVSCNVQSREGVCRGTVGACDLQDMCDGTSFTCRDVKRDAKTVCRAAHGLCDIEERCDGNDADCPEDSFLSSETTCRAMTGSCDVAERCTGTGPDCPPDSLQSNATVCRPAATGKSCDQAELCDGLHGSCPADTKLAPSTACTLSPDDIGTADVACLSKEGSCSEDGNCMPVPLTGHVCFPPDLAGRDPRCFKSSTCDASGQCKVELLPDGAQCGSFCDNSACQAGACVTNPGTHPCGSPDLCDPSSTTPCKDCGDGTVQGWEQCDDGNTDDGDGCTSSCKFSCDPQNPVASCGQTMLAPDVPDPCRHSECQPVDRNPAIDSEGFMCATVADCNSCLTDLGCLAPSDSCQDVHCQANRCVNQSKADFQLAACAFSDPFPGDELSTDARDCGQFVAANGSVCAPAGSLNKPRALCKLWKLEGAARGVLDGSCSADGTKPKAGVMKRIVRPLRQAIFQANSLRTPFKPKITQDCSDALIHRFERMLTNLKSAKTSTWTCSP
jgi:cysteine-rich repeat protein